MGGLAAQQVRRAQVDVGRIDGLHRQRQHRVHRLALVEVLQVVHNVPAHPPNAVGFEGLVLHERHQPLGHPFKAPGLGLGHGIHGPIDFQIGHEGLVIGNGAGQRAHGPHHAKARRHAVRCGRQAPLHRQQIPMQAELVIGVGQQHVDDVRRLKAGAELPRHQVHRQVLARRHRALFAHGIPGSGLTQLLLVVVA